MDARVLRILEFDKIRDLLVDLAMSDMGKERAAELLPSNDYEQVSIFLEQTAEAEAVLFRIGHNPVDAFADVRSSLKRCRVASSMSAKELLEIVKALRAIRLCKEALVKGESEVCEGHIVRMAMLLNTSRSVEEEVFRCIISEDEIADSASSRLGALRRQIKNCNERVREKLNSLIHSQTFKTYLQEPIITVRNGRYVLPVRSEYRAQVPGLLHDQSGSGATLFIEPMAVVEIGNELKKLMAEEREEIDRILAALTAMIAPDADSFLNSLSIMAVLDVIFAKAALSRRMNAVRPKLNDKGSIRVIAGRHPLIDKDEVVPIDVWLGKDFKTLIITGPNTGGKTVTLKTVGLFTVMAQAGLFLPAQTGVEISVFDNVYADIGDEQSIEQSLSTFSSHMKNIVNILSRADDRSLVLLDELGSGTDPIEGAALAMAILDELHSRRSIVLATTHYSELKAFALTREGMENASVEFNVQTLRPTFRLFIGIPGKSNAFEISKRLGLENRIIESAQLFLNHKDVRFEDIISNAESQKRIAEEERALAEAARSELYRLRDEAERERKKLSEQHSKLLTKAQEEAKTLVRRAREETEQIIKELKSAGSTQDQAERSRVIQQARDALRKNDDQLTQKSDKQDKMNNSPPPKTVQPGETVYVVTLDQNATVLSPPDAKGEILVQAGIMKLNVKLKDVRSIAAPKAEQKRTASKVSMEAKRPSLELDVRGMTVDEAILELDKYVDDAIIMGIQELSIIHGKGTGALRAGVSDYLRRNGRVEEYRLGRYGEGETGVTIITLKK